MDRARAAEVAQPCRCQTVGAYLLLRVVQHAPYRTLALPEPQAPDQVDAYEALLRARAARSRRFVTVACGFVAGLSVLGLAEVPPVTKIAPLEAAETRAVTKIADARAAIAAASKRAAEEQLRFTAAIRSATARAEAQGHLESAATETSVMAATAKGRRPCRVALPEPSTLVRGRSAFPLLVASAVEPLRSPSLSGVFADIRRAEAHLDSGRFSDGVLYANALEASAVSRLNYDVVLITSLVRSPVRTSASSFEPGEIVGQAFLYDFAERRVTCAGSVHASSSRQIEYQYVPALTSGASLDPRSEPVYGQGPSLVASLDGDLELQAQRAITRGALYAIDE